MALITNYGQLNRIHNKKFINRDFTEFETKLFNEKLNMDTYISDIPDELDAMCKYWDIKGLIQSDKYLECTNKLVELNDSRGYLRLGLREVDKPGTTREANREQANVYFQKSFEMGNSSAANNLGSYYWAKGNDRLNDPYKVDFLPIEISDERKKNIDQSIFYLEKAFDYEPTKEYAQSLFSLVGQIFMETQVQYPRTVELLDKIKPYFEQTGDAKYLDLIRELRPVMEEVTKAKSEFSFTKIPDSNDVHIVPKKI